MGQQFSFNLTPGRVVTHVERYHFPSGQCRELRKTVVTIPDATGTFRTEEIVEVVPPLDCSCIVEDLHDAVECVSCGAIVCASKHAATCPECGNVFCAACLKVVSVEEQQLRLCEKCGRKLTRHPVVKLVKMIWEMK
jgi:hypothetical protein